MKKRIYASATIILCGCIISCAPEIRRELTSTSLVAPAAAHTLKVMRDASVRLSSGYGRTIKANSEWDLVGTLGPQSVYRPKNNVFTIEGAHVHEAYLLLEADTRVGFYLPGEKSVSQLQERVRLITQ